MDNCGGQNKNYALYTALTDIINTNKISANTITLKYLEAGHTFMSADSCHTRVERQMKKKGDVCDFEDFVNCVKDAGANPITPGFEEFAGYAGGQSQAKLSKKGRPMLADISVAKFERGCKDLQFKTDHADPEYKTFDFLLAKHQLGRITPCRTNNRGFPEIKKQGIIDNLCPLMPQSRREFWKKLDTADVPCLQDNR